MVPLALTSCFVGFRVRGASLRVNGTLFFLLSVTQTGGFGFGLEY